MLPTEEELEEYAVKTMLAFKQEMPQDPQGFAKQNISLEMEERHVVIEVETHDGKTWEKTFSRRKLDQEVNQRATELLKKQEEELKNHAETQESQSKENNQRSGSVADTVKNAV